ncbi:hypothetical protein [Wukongibacter sp. M2B1]|uniref:hypothetical protein n=1 Tax=Wukongibacter sp. M2B1 TaxID=3088895 RepID=UPI003D7B0B13
MSSMTIGVVKEDTREMPISLSFGKMDLNLNKAFYEKYELKNKKNISSNSRITTMREVPDFTLREYDDFSSDFGDIMYVAGYHPATIGDHESASMYVKAWTNKDNIRDYFADYYDSYIVKDSVAVYKMKFKIKNEDYWEADDPTPEDKDKNFDMLLPVYLGSKLSFQLISVPIKTNYTDFTASGSPNENKASWILEKYFGFFETTDAQSDEPWYDDDEYGVGATCTFSYRSSVSSDVDKDIEFYARFYCSATEHESGYTTKYLSFHHDIESTIEVTP